MEGRDGKERPEGEARKGEGRESEEGGGEGQCGVVMFLYPSEWIGGFGGQTSSTAHHASSLLVVYSLVMDDAVQ